MVRWNHAFGVVLLFCLSSKTWAESQPAITSPDSFAGSRTGQERDDNGLKMKFLWCPPGSFTMGSPKDEEGRGEGEDQVKVTLTRGFWLGKYEVTQKQWTQIVASEPWKDQWGKAGPDYPAGWTSWEEANYFCRLLSEQEHQAGRLPSDWECRLPTEAQWEYACRAGTTSTYSFGDDKARLGEFAWYEDQGKNTLESYARIVGSKKPNAWGLFDMHGNVTEWCRDRYSEKLPGGNDPEVVDETLGQIVMRGGRSSVKSARVAARNKTRPNGRGWTTGLRVAIVRPDHPTAPQPAVQSIAVVAFENKGRSVEFNRLGKAIGDMLVNDLMKFDNLSVVERNAADDLVKERALAQSGTTGPSGDAQRKKQSAEYLVNGTFGVDGGKLTIAARLSRTGVDKLAGEWKLEGTVDDLFTIERDLANRVATALGMDDSKRRPAPKPLEGPSPTLAILPLMNHSPNARLDEMQAGFADVLQANLGVIPEIRLVDRDKLDKVLAEQALTLSGLADPATALKVGRLLQAQRLLVGSFLEFGTDLAIQIRLIDTGSGAVVASEKVAGARKQYAALLETLTLQIVADLAVVTPENARQTVQAALPGGSLESALHFATARRLRREGKLPEAAAAYQQAILVDPERIQFYHERFNALSELSQFEDAIRTGQQALAQPYFSRAPVNVRIAFLVALANLYSNQARYDDLVRLTEYARADAATDVSEHLRHLLSHALAKSKRYAEAARMLEQAAANEGERMPAFRSMALRDLFVFYTFYSTEYSESPATVGRDPEASREICRKALEIYDRVVASAEGQRDNDAHQWCGMLTGLGVDIRYADAKGRLHDFLSPAERAEYLKRGLKTFHWHSAYASKVTLALAVNLEKAEKWQEAVEAYQTVMSQQFGFDGESYPPASELQSAEIGSWSDRRAESYFRAGMILDQKLDRKADAREAYQRMVREYGLSHFRGPESLAALQQLGASPDYPEKCALVIGGGVFALRSWEQFLATDGFKVHGHSEYHFTAAHLAPYPLVILARPGNKPFSPTEVLALRSFVACGGSLLAVVTPGWEPAIPDIHNSLLAFFDMEARNEPVVWAESSRIVPHAITAGIEKVGAKQAIGLKARSEAVLIAAGDRTILAATPYRMGRVVVASFGQWLVPDTSIMSRFRWNGLNATHWSRNTPQAEWPFEFERLEHPLLHNVVRWLSEPQADSAGVTRWKRELTSAHLTARIVQSRALPWSSMRPAFEALINGAPDDVTREESLFAAGEACHQWIYTSTGIHLNHPSYGKTSGNTSAILEADPKFHQTLVQQFPGSPLRPYAEVRAADCIRRNATFQEPRVWKPVIAAYEKIKTRPGTYPWVWQNLATASLLVNIGDFAQAAERYRLVGESAPSSTEKTFAVISQGSCYESAGDNNGARRCFDTASSLPHLNWLRWNEHNDWCPVRSRFDPVQGGQFPGDSRELIRTALERLNAKR